MESQTHLETDLFCTNDWYNSLGVGCLTAPNTKYSRVLSTVHQCLCGSSNIFSWVGLLWKGKVWMKKEGSRTVWLDVFFPPVSSAVARRNDKSSTTALLLSVHKCCSDLMRYVPKGRSYRIPFHSSPGLGNMQPGQTIGLDLVLVEGRQNFSKFELEPYQGCD